MDRIASQPVLSFHQRCFSLAGDSLVIEIQQAWGPPVLRGGESGNGFCFLFPIRYQHIPGPTGGTFDPILAAWGPNLLFTALGFYLLLTLDSEKAFPI